MGRQILVSSAYIDNWVPVDRPSGTGPCF